MHQIRIYDTLPPEALTVRITVFVEEQGFTDEVDDIDSIAAHPMMFNGDEPIATCRVFPAADGYILGRLAVLKEYRGQSCGRAMLVAAEEYVRSVGGNSIALHAQCHAQAFYEKCGYTACSEVEDEQGCPHIWMKKEWQ